MTRLTELLLLGVVVGMAALVVTTGFFAWHMLRRVRRWRTRVSSLAPQALTALTPEGFADLWVRAHRTSLAARAVVGTGVRRQSLWNRRDLWVHVDGAGRAVKEASAAGAPVGDLPLIVRQLEAQARHHDRLLVLSNSRTMGSVDGSLGEETRSLIARADSVTGAALSALRSDGAMRWADLGPDLDRETAAVVEGAALARGRLRPFRQD